MTKYEVEFTKTSQKELNRLPKEASKRILKAIYKLSSNPRLRSVRPMVGTSSWRLRVGDHRVIYDIHDNHLVILIIRIRYRKDAYKK